MMARLIKQVALVGGDNKASFVTVKLGDEIGSFVVVKKGLKTGDRIVVEGLQKIREGVVVAPKTAPKSLLPKPQTMAMATKDTAAQPKVNSADNPAKVSGE